MVYKINDEWYNVDNKQEKYFCEYDHGDNEVFATYSIHKSEKEWLGFAGSTLFDDCKRFSCDEHKGDLWVEVSDVRWEIINTNMY